MKHVDRVEVYDTTLRDGTQREGMSLSCEDKLRIAERLDALGIPLIEAGWPGSNAKDAELFRRLRTRCFDRATVVAFGATRRVGLKAQDDPSLRALLDSEAPTCAIFGKSSVLHVTEVLRATLSENLAMIEQSVALLRSHDRRVVYDAEHFFDGFAADPAYCLATLRAAIDGGASCLVLCDTNGGAMPWTVHRTVREVAQLFDVPIGIHAHDDGGMAVANSLAAVRAGARHVQGTINGYGERCGNANLCAVIPNLELKLGMRALPEGALEKLFEVSHFVAEIANLTPNEHMPYVGRSAFAHKAGVHVSAMRRNAEAYQHVQPERIGNHMRVVVSELSGRSNVLSKAEELGLDVADGAESEVLERIKQSEAVGYAYEAAPASVALMLKRHAPSYRPLFSVRDYKVFVGSAFVEATVKVEMDSELVTTMAEGNGPVAALDAALRKALSAFFPSLEEISLTDYKVRILDGRDGTSAVTRVLIAMSDGQQSWCTVGASSNIIEASCRALVDGIEHGLGIVNRQQRRAS